MSRVFDGIDDYLQRAASFGASPVSYAVWYKLGTDTTPDSALIMDGKAGLAIDNNRLTLIPSGGSPVTARSTNSAGTSALAQSTAGAQENTNWHLAIGVHTSATSRAAYFDGANKGTNATNIAVTGQDTFRVGRRLDDTSPFDGKIAHVAVWDTTLSDANAVALGGGDNPTTVATANLIAYWPLTGASLTDVVSGFVLSASGTTVDTGDNPAVDAFVPALVGAPDVTPTSDGYEIDFETDSQCDAHFFVYAVGTATPTDLADAQSNDLATEVDAGVNGVGSVTFTGLTRPIHKIVVILDGPGGESTPEVLSASEERLPATGWAFSIADGTVGTHSIYEGASPAIDAGVYNEYKATTEEAAYPVTIEPDGDIIYEAGGDASRQSGLFQLYYPATDTFEDHFTNLEDRWWRNNDDPAIDPELGSEEFDIYAEKDVAITALELQFYIVDDDDATHTWSEITKPTGISTDSAGQLTGTPTVFGWPSANTDRAADVTGASIDLTLNIYVGTRIADVADDDAATATSTIEGQGLTVTESTESSSTVPEGDVIRTVPPADTIVEDGSEVTLIVSSGPAVGGRGKRYGYGFGFGMRN